MPIMLNILFKDKAQFAWGTRAVAFLISGLLVIASSLMRTRVPGRKAGENAHKQSVAAIKAAALDWPYVSYVIGYVWYYCPVVAILMLRRMTLFCFGVYFPCAYDAGRHVHSY